MLLFLAIYIILILPIIQAVCRGGCQLKIVEIKLRPVRNGDIGLYFDVTVVNDDDKPDGKTIGYRITSDLCCLRIHNVEEDCEISRMFGGSFEPIAPGKTAIITLIWPGLTLYNRIGACLIKMSSEPNSNCTLILQRKIEFDTMVRFHPHNEILSEYEHIGNITECQTEDLNPFSNCEPVYCPEKYFGSRNYFNSKLKICQAVPACGPKRDTIYDFANNDCIDLNNIVTDQELTQIKNGEFDKNVWKEATENDIANYNEVPFAQSSLLRNDSNFMVYTSILAISCVITYFLLSGLLVCFLYIFFEKRRDDRKKKKNNEKLRLLNETEDDEEMEDEDEQDDPFVIE